MADALAIHFRNCIRSVVVVVVVVVVVFVGVVTTVVSVEKVVGRKRNSV